MSNFELVIVRHGKAASGLGQRDEDRPLTDPGKDSFAAAARGLARVLTPPVEIISSPFLRARQTANILFEALEDAGISGFMEEMEDQLMPHGSPSSMQDLVLERIAGGQRGTLLLVTHMPLAGDLAGLLALGGRSLPLTTGEACCLQVGPGGAHLLWKCPEFLTAQLGTR